MMVMYVYGCLKVLLRHPRVLLGEHRGRQEGTEEGEADHLEAGGRRHLLGQPLGLADEEVGEGAEAGGEAEVEEAAEDQQRGRVLAVNQPAPTHLPAQCTPIINQSIINIFI